jgi:poly(glycerol-phosphate) alpha-glucosyltransferase
VRALCEAEAQSIRAYGIRNPICVIPNGVDLPPVAAKTTDHGQQTTGPQSQWSAAFAEATAAKVVSGQWPEFGGQKILLYLGRLHPKKNVASLVRAWKQVLSSHASTPKEWALAIAGWDEASYERELKNMISDYGLTASIGVLGPLFGPEKDAAFRACDAFILPSLSEGLPITVLEAWAYAKPVLMTAECNLLEGFAAGAALRIGTDPEQIAAGLKQLIEMTDQDRGTMGDHGRRLVATKFSWPQIGEQMRSVYEWVLGGATPPATVRLAHQ